MGRVENGGAWVVLSGGRIDLSGGKRYLANLRARVVLRQGIGDDIRLSGRRSLNSAIAD